MGDLGLIPGSEDPLEKRMEPTPVFFLGEFHGQRRLVGSSLWGHKESDLTERLTLSLCFTVKQCGFLFSFVLL